MRILHISDVHGRLDWLAWTDSSMAPAHDVLVVSGDFVDVMGRAPVWEQRRDIRQWCCARVRPTFLCSGNNDLNLTPDGWEPATWMARLSAPFVAVDGESRTIGDYHFEVVAWGRLPSGNVQDRILVMHQPPANCAASGNPVDGDAGDPDMIPVCAGPTAPRLILCGHMHHPSRWWALCGRSVVVNPGSDLGESIPRHVVIDFRSQVMEWNSASRSETAEWPEMSADSTLLMFDPHEDAEWIRQTLEFEKGNFNRVILGGDYFDAFFPPDGGGHVEIARSSSTNLPPATITRMVTTHGTTIGGNRDFRFRTEAW